MNCQKYAREFITEALGLDWPDHVPVAGDEIPIIVDLSIFYDLNNLQKTNPIVNIPEFFLSSQFTPSDTSTCDLVFLETIPWNCSLPPTNSEQTKSPTISTSSDKCDANLSRQSTSNGFNNTNPSNSSSPKHSTSSSTRILQDKYTHYFDEIELFISRALSTKSHCFHDAVRSHDEIQSFLSKTCYAIESLHCKLLIMILNRHSVHKN